MFIGWSGDLASDANPATFAITSNMNVHAICDYAFSKIGWPVPGLVEAENFNEGGEGVSYHDVSPTNEAEYIVYRDTAVDIVPHELVPGYRVAYNNAGEWRNYTLNVASNGFYYTEIHAGTELNNAAAHFEFCGGGPSTGIVALTNSGYLGHYGFIHQLGWAAQCRTASGEIGGRPRRIRYGFLQHPSKGAEPPPACLFLG